jgi:glutaryl-CoA dehydrogenase
MLYIWPTNYNAMAKTDLYEAPDYYLLDELLSKSIS